jgi:glycosyltransferase involved in cell wall biosynthesis
MLKVNIIGSFFPPEKGAAPSRLYKLAMLLQQHGYDVEVLAPMPNYPTGKIFDQYRGKLKVVEIIQGIKTRRYWVYPTNSSHPAKRIVSMFSFVASLLLAFPYLKWQRRAAVYIINTPPLPVGFIGVHLAKWCGATAIANISDVWPLTALEMGAMKQGGMYRFLEALERSIYARSDAWMTQSEEAMTHVKATASVARPQFLFRNLDVNSPYQREQLPLEGHPLKIVYAGLLGVAQGVFAICQHIDFRGLNAELHIYGNGHDRSLIEAWISSRPNCNIYLYDTIPKHEVPTMLAQHHVVLVPLSTRIYGAFPSKIFMGVAAGLPILFCGTGEGRAVIEQYGIGYGCDSADFEALTQNILRVQNGGDAAYLQLKQRCIEASSRGFNIEVQNEAFLQFLSKLLLGHG